MKKLIHNKWVLVSLALVILSISLYAAKTKILTAIGEYLIVDTAVKPTAHIVVLSGGAIDRCAKAYEIYKQGGVQNILLTGGNPSKELCALGINFYESDMLYYLLTHKYNLPDSIITLVHKGTSTLEEAYLIKAYCLKKNIKSITIVSSSFHTRRVSQVMKRVLGKEGIQFYVAAAPNQTYNAANWWKNEYGLIACNNEYIKQIYYLFK